MFPPSAIKEAVKMEKTEYITLDMEIIEFEAEDIVTLSGGEGDEARDIL